MRTSQNSGGTSYTSPQSFKMAEKSGTRVTRPSEHKAVRQSVPTFLALKAFRSILFFGCFCAVRSPSAIGSAPRHQWFASPRQARGPANRPHFTENGPRKTRPKSVPGAATPGSGKAFSNLNSGTALAIPATAFMWSRTAWWKSPALLSRDTRAFSQIGPGGLFGEMAVIEHRRARPPPPRPGTRPFISFRAANCCTSSNGRRVWR